MEIGKLVCERLQHNVGGTLIELEGGKCKVETEEISIVVEPDGTARLEPKKAPEYEILKKYANELRKVYIDLKLMR